MARTLDPVAHEIRREAFVEAAMGLMTVKGYDGMSIQDVLDATGASRGAFYHYFDSKAALREAVMERIVEAATDSVMPAIADPDLSAVEKLERLAGGLAQWKGERTELLEGVLRVWMSDDNALVRERFRQVARRRLIPAYTTILVQGKREGSMTITDPEASARVLASFNLALNELATELYFARQSGEISFEDVERQLMAAAEGFERTLGLPAGSWPYVDRDVLRKWFG